MYGVCSSFPGRAGVPMEVMGLMLGQFVDDYTITCVDVFAMPQVIDNLLIASGVCVIILTLRIKAPKFF
jgi:hypothetical protein